MRYVSGGRWWVLTLMLALVAVALAGPASGRGQAAAGGAVQAIVPLGPSPDASDAADWPEEVLVDAAARRVYAVASNGWSGRLTVLDAATARVLRRLAVPPSAAFLNLDARRHRLLLVAALPEDAATAARSPGGVLLVDTRRLAVVARLAAGYNPAALAYDAGRGRLFVSAGGQGHPGRIATIDAASGRVLRAVALGPTFERGVTGAAVAPRRGRLLAVVAYGSEAAVTATARAIVLDAAGRLLHTVPLGSIATGDIEAIPRDPAAMNGQVAVDAATGRAFVLLDAQVLMLDPASGRVLARAALPPASGGGAGAMAVDAATGRVFVVAAGGVATLDAGTGRQRRFVPVAQPMLTLAAALGRVYVESWTVHAARLLMLDASSGAVARTVDLGAHAAVLEAVDARTGRLFLTNTHFNQDGDAVGPGAIDVRDARSGALLAHVVVGQNPEQVAVDGRTGGAFALDQTADTLIALAPGVGTGPPLPPTPVPPTPTPSPARVVPLLGIDALAADSRTHRAFVGQFTGVRMLDTQSGRTLRMVPLGGFSDVLAVDERRGRVIASRGQSAVSVLDARTGALRRTVRLPYRVAAIALDARTGTAYLAGTGPPPTRYGTRPGYVSALDPATGRLRYTVPVERELYALALDAATGHLFVGSLEPSNVVMLDAARPRRGE